MALPTIRERILLHLRNYVRFKHDKVVPFAISQPGIADHLGITRSHVSKEMIRLKEASRDLVEEKIRHVEGSKRRRKVYFLTPMGIDKADSLVDGLAQEKIIIKDKAGKKEISFSEVRHFLNVLDPTTYALKKIDDDRVLDLTRERGKEDLFVGREEELERLKDLLEEVKNGHSRVVLVDGEAGIGKTRLIQEFKPIALDQGFMFIEGSCKTENADPYLPFREAFFELVESEAIGITKFENLLSTRVGKEPEDKISLDALKEAVFYDTTSTLRELSKKIPLFIFIDDMHWADRASLDLFRYIAETLDEDRVLLIATYRPEEVSLEHPLRDMISLMGRMGVHEDIELKPFDPHSTKEVIDGMTGNDAPEDFVEFIHGKTRGNPLFIRQLIRDMIEASDIDVENNEYPTEEIELTVPEVVTHIVQRKLSRLTRDARRVLELGSVLGKEFSFDILGSISDLSEMKLLDQIDMLVDQGIWCEHDELDRFYFMHELVREAIYTDLKRIRRKRLHKSVADSMKEHHSRTMSRLSEIANHYRKAEEYDDALDNFIKAGEYAESVYAQENALELYHRGLELTQEVSVDKEYSLSLLERLGDTYTMLGRYEEGREYYLRYLDGLAEDLDSKEFMTRMYRKIAKTWLMQGDFEKAMDYTQKGIAIGAEDTLEWCILLNVKGWTYMKKGDYQRASRIFKEELAVAEELRDEKEMARAYHNLGTIELQKGEFDDAGRHLQRAIDGFTELDEKVDLSKSLNNLGVLHLRKHEIDEALDYNKRSLKILDEVGDIQGVAMNLNNIGIIYTEMGKYSKALNSHHKSMDIKNRIGDLQGLAESHTNIGVVHEKRGDLDKALKEYRMSWDIFHGIGDKRGMAESLNDMGWIYHLKGDIEGSLEKLYDSLSLRKELGDLHGIAESYRNLGIVLSDQGSLEKGKEHFEAGLEMAEDAYDIKEIALISKGLADLLVEMGEYSEAREYYIRSMDISEQIEDDAFKVVSSCGLAFAYLHMGEEDEAERLAEEAHELSMDMDMEHAMAHRVLGTICRVKGRLNRAQDELWNGRDVLKEDDEHELAKILYQQAMVCMDMDEKEMAKRFLEQALEEVERTSSILMMDKIIAELEKL